MVSSSSEDVNSVMSNLNHDINKENFDYVEWTKSHVANLQNHGITIKAAGFLCRHLSVFGNQSSFGNQADVGSVLTAPFRPWEHLKIHKKVPRTILKNFNGFVTSGELLLVLGRPGAGCSTFLKTIAGQLEGLKLDKDSLIHYSGIPWKQMLREFRGEILYNQEVDKHFPHLTVSQTLDFAAKCRTSRTRPGGASEKDSADMIRDLVISVFGLLAARNTRVGNDLVRGVSGGERKRLSIAEMAIAGAPIGCWDNSTRGLDSGSALAFAQALRRSSDLTRATHAVAIYQASQSIYDLFDKVTLLYEGKQIFFGPAERASAFFEEMGWEISSRQTTSDFLTALTNPTERRARAGYENKVPRTPEEFESHWIHSHDYALLEHGLSQYEAEFPLDDSDTIAQFQTSRHADRSRLASRKSPYTISIPKQIRICTVRAYQRVWNDRSSTMSMLFGQVIMALIIGSLFYGQPNATISFFSRGGVLFFTLTINALLAITEINGLYEQRPIVAKHASYAFCAPIAEAMASVLADLPVKFLANVAFNIILYFLANLRETPSAFFVFFLFNFLATLAMSLIFRTVAQATKTISQAMVIAGVLVMALVIYAGFTPPVPAMHPWFSWIRYLNPVGYAFESLMLNEFHDRDFPCSDVVPSYPGFQQKHNNMPYFSCSVKGSVAGQSFVSGDAYIQSSFQYEYSHIWRNLGIMLGMIVFLFCLLMVVATYISTGPTAADMLIFRRKQRRELEKQKRGVPMFALEVDDDTSQSQVIDIGSTSNVFTWKDVRCDIKAKKESRRLLDHVSGWVKPGSLTALMGVSGAGKTTLLDTLALRMRTGVVAGDIRLNGESARESQSFQRRTGYVQQQDLLSETTSVRENLRFSAMLRQPANVSVEEKHEYVESVIRLLRMETFANAITGQPGSGLNAKQRKLLSIGVELVAKPALLFLDEPTSGLDSQSSWAIVSVLRRLADQGQTILCTIHQPSSTLFEQFDRLLFLAKSGRTAYFGPTGFNSRDLLDYFESNGARKCNWSENPAEYIIEVVSENKTSQDWPGTWNKSGLSKEVNKEVNKLLRQSSKPSQQSHSGSIENQATSDSLYAMPFWTQQKLVTHRLFKQYWRTPSYVLGKAALGTFASLFISFSFYKIGKSQQDLQDATFSIFMLLSTFTVVVQQIMPQFLTQRALYEVRERPSHTYSWFVFITANIVVELSYQVIVAIGVFGCWTYPTYGIVPSPSQGYILLVVVQFYIFGSSFAHLLSAALPNAQTAGTVATLLFTLILAFNGVFVPPNALPGFWVFLYRISPLTYIVSALSGAALHGRPVVCAQNELVVFQPPGGQTCGTYLADFLATAPGQLLDPAAMQDCSYCSLSNADEFLAGYDVSYHARWRNFGIVWGFIVFNIFMTFTLYYLFRVKTWKRKAT